MSSLPDSATRKLAMLTQAAEDARALAFSAKDKVSVLASKVVQLRNARATEADVKRAMEQHERARPDGLSRSVVRIRRAVVCEAAKLDSRIANRYALEAVAAPTVAMNGSPASAVAGVRSQIVALATEFHQIKTAGRTCDDARAQINALVQSLAARGRPRMDVQRGEVRVYGWMGDEISHGVPVPHVDNLQTICWLAPHMVIDKLDEMLEALPVDAHALPISERAERLAGIEEKIFDLEIQEECVVEAAAEDGVVIPRRSDASPASILGVRVIGEATEREAA